VSERIIDIIIKILQYALLPITYPIYLIQMRKLDRRIDAERAERKRIQENNKRLGR